MNQKIYDLMNWPEIEGIVYSECDKPSELLGGHVCDAGFLIQTFHPEAVEITVEVEGKKRHYQMEKVDEAGYFAAIIPGRGVQSYQLTVENLQGRKDTFRDPYAYSVSYNNKAINRFLAGNDTESDKLFGAHKTRIGKVKGVSFTVWAPDAIRVSVVGDFNRWDGRIHQMNRLSDSGIFSLFIPDLPDDTVYQYEIKMHGSKICLKTDPYSYGYSCDNGYASMVIANHKHKWQDAAWQEQKQLGKKEMLSTSPMSVYELDTDDLKETLLKGDLQRLVTKVHKLGFTHVELMPLCEYVSDESLGYETLGYYGLSHRFGNVEAVCSLIDAFHQESIGVIMDFNAAFMGTDKLGLCQFDGTQLYETGRTNLGAGQTLSVATFDYRKPEVRSYLLSAILYWVNEFHLDGIRLTETASMLYLNYGKKPGEWKPNLFGGYENSEAIGLIAQIRLSLDKKAPGTLFITQESSAWPKVTGQPIEDTLGFDLKWNYGWKQSFLRFLFLDPLFRKGMYEELVSSMLYQYSESFILELSHKDLLLAQGGDQYTECANQRLSLSDHIPGNNEKEKLANIRTAYAYLYFHPGKKLLYEKLADNLSDKLTDKLEAYLQALNEFYRTHEELYDQDEVSEGFSWIDDTSAEETVIAFIRRSEKNQELLVVINFTPVVRSKYAIRVNGAGKYREVFNSDLKEYGGDGISNPNVIRSEADSSEENENSIEIVLPPMSAVVFSYEPYTMRERQEIEIREEASRAKAQAEARAQEAEELRRKAEAEAQAALEAEKLARETAKRALEAKEEAKKRAQEAEETSLKIEEEAKKRIAALKSR